MAPHTEKRLRLALLRVANGRPIRIDGNRKLSIKAVAEEAGVSAALIHNRYPSVAAEIRKRVASKRTKAAACEIPDIDQRGRVGNASLRRDISRLASVNATLQLQVRKHCETIEELERQNAALSTQAKGYMAQLNSKRGTASRNVIPIGKK